MTRGWIVSAILLMLPTPAPADSCDTLMAAYDKEARTPHRYDNTVLHDGKPEMEFTEISVGDRTFTRKRGILSYEGWRVSHWDPGLGAANYRRFRARNEPTCHADGTETIDGEPTDIIASVNVTGFTTRIWISRTTGLPVKEEGDPEDGRTSLSTYSYNNITAPDTN